MRYVRIFLNNRLVSDQMFDYHKGTDEKTNNSFFPFVQQNFFNLVNSTTNFHDEQKYNYLEKDFHVLIHQIIDCFFLIRLCFHILFIILVYYFKKLWTPPSALYFGFIFITCLIPLGLFRKIISSTILKNIFLGLATIITIFVGSFWKYYNQFEEYYTYFCLIISFLIHRSMFMINREEKRDSKNITPLPKEKIKEKKKIWKDRKETNKKIHLKNKKEYETQRENLLKTNKGQFIAFSNGKILKISDSQDEVFKYIDVDPTVYVTQIGNEDVKPSLENILLTGDLYQHF